MLAREQQDVTREAASASHDAIGPDADPDLRFLLPDIHHETIASRDVVRGSPWCEAPRIDRSSIPTRIDLRDSPQPANSEVRTALFSGLVSKGPAKLGRDSAH